MVRLKTILTALTVVSVALYLFVRYVRSAGYDVSVVDLGDGRGEIQIRRVLYGQGNDDA